MGSNNVDQVGAFRDQWSLACESAGLSYWVAAGHVPWGEDAIVFFRQLDCPTAAMQERENAVFREAMSAQGLALPQSAEAGEEVTPENQGVCAGFWKSPGSPGTVP